MFSDPFGSPKSRLARAKENIAKLKAGINVFGGTNPYATVVDVDPKTGKHLYKIKMTAALPDEFTHLAVEIVEALRAALDQTGYSCARVSGNKRLKHTYFPFADSPGELANVIRGRCKDIPSDIIAVFSSFHPYKGGNDPLWAMNKMANTKHTALVPVGMAAGGAHIQNLTSAGPGGFEIIAPIWDGSKNEMLFARTDPAAELKYNINFSFYVSLGGVPTLASKPVQAVFRHLASTVEQIIGASEAECRRLGFLK